MLAALIVVAAVILLLTLVINGPNRMLTSEELALEQTRIAQEIVLKQTEVAKTSAAGLYLTHIRYPAHFALPESSERWLFA